MTEAGTYRKPFDDAIDTLAGMFEKRDALEEEYANSGESMIVEHTNKGGATNLEQNPAIRLLNDMNKNILSYLRDLGLTPKGLRAINDNALTVEKKDPFLEALDKLGV